MSKKQVKNTDNQQNDKERFKTSIGGQALIEGIMMRGPDKTAIVVNGPNGQEVKEYKNVSYKEKFPPAGWAFIRGVVGLVTSLKQGMAALTWSAGFFPEDEGEPSKFDAWLENKLGSKKAEKLVTTIAMALGLILAVGLFTILPTFLVGLFNEALGSGVLRNLVETAIRLVILLGYMLLVSRMKEIQRVFSYHGAEHKTIACYEAGDALTVENVRKHSRFHPRCGTSFLLMVVIIGFVSFLWVSEDTLGPIGDITVVRILLRFAMLPIVVGVSYEVNRLIGRHDNVLTRVLRAPGLALQNFTTREPDNSMIEVGIAALTYVLPKEKGADAWDRQ